MNITSFNPVDSLMAANALPNPATGALPGADFARLLDDERLEQREAEAREAAQDMVAVTLLMPLLKQVRNDPFRSDLFHGGQGEEAFGAQLDQQIAQSMSRSMKFPLTDAITRHLTRGAGAGKVDRHG